MAVKVSITVEGKPNREIELTAEEALSFVIAPALRENDDSPASWDWLSREGGFKRLDSMRDFLVSAYQDVKDVL